MAKRARAKAGARIEAQAISKKTEKPVSKYLIWGLLALTMVIVIVIRARMLGVPLERDEGEYAYAGRLLLQGVPPYSLVYNMKFAGIYVAYALIMAVFGQSAQGIHLGLLAFNLASIALVFVLARRLFDPYTGLVAAGAFATFSLARFVLGFAAHATNFILVPMLAGLLLTLTAVKSRKLLPAFLGGLLLGMAPMIKQQGAPFVLFGLLYVVWKMLAERAGWKASLKSSLAFVAGAVVPFAVVVLWMRHAGVFGNFWFWCFKYARQYASEVPLSVGITLLRDQIGFMFGSGLILMCLAIIGLAVTPFDPDMKHKRAFVLGFVLFSFLCVCPGLYFREHYFVLLLPALAMLVGIGVRYARQALIRLDLPWLAGIPALVFLVGVGYLMHAESFLMFATPSAYLQRSYPDCPFGEAVEVGKYIKEHAHKGDKLVVIGSEPEIYFYSGLRPATGYIYAYPLTEKQKYAHKMEQEMIGQVESSKPRFIVLVDVTTSLYSSPSDNKSLSTWATDYCVKNGNLIGLVDMVAPGASEYYWGADAGRHQRTSASAIAVFERKQ
jgi:hypothetical protein